MSDIVYIKVSGGGDTQSGVIIGIRAKSSLAVGPRQQTNQITLLEWGKGHALTPRNNELLFARINPYKNSRCIQGCHLLLMSNIPCKHIVSKRVYNFLATGLAILWIGLSISILVIRT